MAESIDKSKKGMSYGELIVDNILGLDNEYESFGEKLGKAINEDEIGFLKNAALGIYEGAKDFVSAPVESTKEIISDVKKSVERLGRENLDTRLRNMYNVSYKDATYKQVTDAKQAVISDAITALELVPVGAAAVKGTKTAVEAGVKAIPPDAIGQTKALLEGDKEFLKGTPTPKAKTAGVGAQVVRGIGDNNPPIDAPLTKSKKETNLLVKERKYNSGIPSDLYDFRSSILGSLDNLAIGKDGMSGLQIKKFLEKRAPKINKTELYWSGLLENLEDNKKYSKGELENFINYNVPRVDIEVYAGPSDTKYFGTQRVVFQRNDPFNDEIIEPLDEYREILLVNHNTKGTEYSSADAHFKLPKGQNLLGHVRGSFVEADADPNADFAIKEKFFVVEELQSDAVQQHTVADKATAKHIKKLETEKPTLGDIGLYYQEEFGLATFAHHMEGLEFTNKFIKDIDSYNYNFRYISDQETAEQAVNLGLTRIVDDMTKLKARFLNGDTTKDAIVAKLSQEYGLKESSIQRRSIQELDEIDNIFANVLGDYVFGKTAVRKYNKENNNNFKEDLINIFKGIGIKDPIQKDIVPAKLSDTIRMSLLATIREAKSEGANKIYIPSPKVIAKAHELSLDAANNTYKDGVKKVLRSLNSETNGKIKFKNKNPDGLHYYEDYESTGIEIDIKDFELPQDPQFRFAEGGSVKNMNKQMEMMFEEGGIADDGMKVDPVSGNEIPPGSMAEEVRDDVPAQLSEGEYVVPADVVRFYGVKFFEDLRTEAKRGLMEMERGGRIGGEPVEEPVRPQLEKMERPRRNVAMSRGGIIATSMNYEKTKRAFNTGGVNLDTFKMGSNIRPNLDSMRFGTGGPKRNPLGSGLHVVEYRNEEGDVRWYTFLNGVLQPPGSKIAPGYFPIDQQFKIPTGETVPEPEESTPTPTPTNNDDNDDPPIDPQDQVDRDMSKQLKELDWNGDVADQVENILGAMNSHSNIKKVGMGVSLVNPVAGALVGLGATVSSLETISNARAIALVEQARGNTDSANKINKMIDEAVQARGGFVDMVDGIFAKGTMRANDFAKDLGYTSYEDMEKLYKTNPEKALEIWDNFYKTPTVGSIKTPKIELEAGRVLTDREFAAREARVRADAAEVRKRRALDKMQVDESTVAGTYEKTAAFKAQQDAKDNQDYTPYYQKQEDRDDGKDDFMEQHQAFVEKQQQKKEEAYGDKADFTSGTGSDGEEDDGTGSSGYSGYTGAIGGGRAKGGLVSRRKTKK